MLVRGADFIDCRLIYGLVDPLFAARVRYVGQTTRAPIARYLSHVSATSNGMERAAWVRQLKTRGRRPDMVLLEHVPADVDLDDRELWWIWYLKSQGQADCNSPVPKWFAAGESRPPSPWYVTGVRRGAVRVAP